MYQITCDNEILYDIRLKNRLVLSPTLDLETGKNGTLSFIIPPSNDLYNSIQQRKSIIKVYQVDKVNNSYVKTELFRGIAYSEKTDFWKRKQIECEGELSFFNDTVVRPYNFEGTVTNLFKQYINNHNSQVASEKQFTPRNCDFTSNVARANINYPSTKEEIDNKLINLLGGHFEVEESSNIRYIDYKQNYSNTATQYIEFGKNLLNITQFIKTDDVATRIIPLRKKR